MLSIMLTRRKFLTLMGASAGAAATGSELLSQAAASASAAPFRGGSDGAEPLVVLMMENPSFHHFLSWLPHADGRHDTTYLPTYGNLYPQYPPPPDSQPC